jgi:hypothetical protein
MLPLLFAKKINPEKWLKHPIRSNIQLAFCWLLGLPLVSLGFYIALWGLTQEIKALFRRELICVQSIGGSQPS